MDNYAGIKAICVLVRDDERLAPGSSTAAELDSLFHGVQRKTLPFFNKIPGTSDRLLGSRPYGISMIIFPRLHVTVVCLRLSLTFCR